ncbi:MAG TPA: regulatory iron-sulfur-containing complex subunit RicT, partial [Gemmatimonadaceae bacterium]|nr:regulatory iron-sulfur-containing complex subunit RicT [Gemmatimonadaceae bacterium]
MVIEVSFKGNRREFFDWPFPEAPALRTPVIVEVERGEDLGRVHATGELALKRKAGTSHGQASREPLRKAVRAANGDEIARAAQLRADEANVRARAIEKVRALGLDLKVSDTEWQWDRKRLTVYFTSDQRVDFRQLVRQLEGLFGTRVHMWHIGVRDEARRVDGVGRCGRQLCSASWLPELVPVKSSVAKDQHLSTLNPAQISGACGRLMCCLRYEHEFYVAQRKRFPKEGRVIRTSAGEEKVLSLDIFRETVTLRALGGEARVVPLARLRQELQGELPPWALRGAPGGDTVTPGAASDTDETADEADTGADGDANEDGGTLHSMEFEVVETAQSAPRREAPRREPPRREPPPREPPRGEPRRQD